VLPVILGASSLRTYVDSYFFFGVRAHLSLRLVARLLSLRIPDDNV